MEQSMLNSFSPILKRNMFLVLPIMIIGIMKHYQIINDIESITAMFIAILLFVAFLFLSKEKEEKDKELNNLFS